MEFAVTLLRNPEIAAGSDVTLAALRELSSGDDIEDWLIGFASRRTNKLLNIHGTRPTPWSIVGVANHGKSGHPGSSAFPVIQDDDGYGHEETQRVRQIAHQRRHGNPQPQTVESVSPDTEEAASIEQDVGGDDALEVTSGSAVGPDPTNP